MLVKRPRRLRINELVRNLVQENNLQIKDFIMPIFICSGTNIKIPIQSLEGHFQYSIDQAIITIKKWKQLKLKTFMLFEYLQKKTRKEVMLLV